MTDGVGDLAYRDGAGGEARHISFRRWRVDPGRVLLHAWEGEDDQLVFDERTGHTHSFGPVEAWILRLLMQETLGVAEVARRLADGLGKEPDAGFVSYVEAVLAALEEQALAERAPL